MYSVADLLSYRALMRPVLTKKTGIPNAFPPEFFSVTEELLGNQAELVEMPGNRRVAAIAPYMAPPKQVPHLPLAERPLTLLHSIEEMAFRDEFIRVLRAWDDYKPQQPRAILEIKRQGEGFVARQDNLQVASLTQFLATGKNYYDANNNLLPTPPPAGTGLVVDQGVPAANQGQLGGVISQSWADPTCDIVSQINAIKQQAVLLTGYPLEYVFYGINIPKYFANNNSIKGLWNFNQAKNEEYLTTGVMPKTMLDLKWVPAFNQFFEDANGVNQLLFPADQATFTPQINEDTYAFYRGSYPVPSTFGPLGDAEAMLKSWTEVTGRFRYAYMVPGRPGIMDVMGDTWLFRFKVPQSYFLADVTP